MNRRRDARAAASNTQHWGRVCLPPRQCTSKSSSWHSQASVLWDTPNQQSWHVASQQSWPKPGSLLHLGHDAGACIPSTNLQYAWDTAAACWDMLNFSTAQCTMQLISREKDWKHIIMQTVVTLNTCCDVACLTVKFPHITTAYYHSQNIPILEGQFWGQKGANNWYTQSESAGGSTDADAKWGVLDGGAYWRNLVNTTERSVCRGDVVLCLTK